MISRITNSNFENIKKVGNGSAINIQNSAEVSIISCFFKNNVVSEWGGAFYISANNNILKKNMFVECFSTKRANQICGNAGFIAKGESKLEHINIHKCGPSTTEKNRFIH